MNNNHSGDRYLRSLGLRPAHRAADTGNGFDECHILKRFIYTYIYEKFPSKF